MKLTIETGSQKLEFTPTFDQVGRIIEILGQRRPTPQRLTDLARISDLVISASGKQITKKDRHADMTRPRNVYYYLAKKYTGRSLKEISAHIGSYDHSSVIHGIRVCKGHLADGDNAYCELTNAVEKLISAHLEN